MVSTKSGQKFLALIEKPFPSNNPLSKIFNKNMLKLSYSCTDNIEKILKCNILNKHLNINNNSDSKAEINNINNKLCNCRNPVNCPLQNVLLTLLFTNAPFHVLKTQLLRNFILVAQKTLLNKGGINIYLLTTMHTITKHPSLNIFAFKRSQ